MLFCTFQDPPCSSFYTTGSRDKATNGVSNEDRYNQCLLGQQCDKLVLYLSCFYTTYNITFIYIALHHANIIFPNTVVPYQKYGSHIVLALAQLFQLQSHNILAEEMWGYCTFWAWIFCCEGCSIWICHSQSTDQDQGCNNRNWCCAPTVSPGTCPI